MPAPVELQTGRRRRLWHTTGALAAGAAIVLSGLSAPGQWLALTLLALVVWWCAARAPRPLRIRPDDDGWRVLFSDGVERAARPGTTTGPWPGVITLGCGWRRLLIFDDECSTADFRRLKRGIRT